MIFKIWFFLKNKIKVIWVGGNHSEIVFVLSEETNALCKIFQQ